MRICTKCNGAFEPSEFYKKTENRLSGACKKCHNKAVREWQLQNKEKVRGYVRKACKSAYDANPEKFREKSLLRRQLHPEKTRASVNKSYSKIYAERYEMERSRLNAASAARRRLPPKWLDAIAAAQLLEFYDLAKAITVQSGVKHHVDHIIPLNGKSVNGLHVPWNLQIITARENCAKGAKLTVT